MRAEARALFERLGVPIDPDRIAEGLSIADQQIIEIAKAISLDAKVLVMDEPTAALSRRRGRSTLRRRPQPARRGRRHPVHLAPLRRGLRPHRPHHRHARRPLHRDPRHAPPSPSRRSCARWSAATSTSSSPRTGRDRRRRAHRRGLSRRGRLRRHRPSRFAAGEIVALAGLVGAGRTEVARAVFGIDAYDTGTVELLGRPLRSRAIRRPPSTPASASSPRTAASRASSWTSPSPATRR